MTRKEAVSTLATVTAVVMTAVTDAPVIFIPGSLGGLTSFRVVLYCRLGGRKHRKQMKKVFKHLRLNHRKYSYFGQTSTTERFYL